MKQNLILKKILPITFSIILVPKHHCKNSTNYQISPGTPDENKHSN